MPLHIARTIQEMRSFGAHHDLAFVPTMGNLHEGHISLVRLAKPRGSRTVASIFVNPLQFAPTEDFDAYPRTFERDCELLEDAGCDAVFAPPVAQMYPEPQTFRVQPDPALGNILEGEFRPGFFEGVCTVVMKLFQAVQPRVAVFGKKDYQQLRVIEAMVRQFALPIDIVAGPTGRAPSGLALSSRNGYLSDSELRKASELSQTLRGLVAEAEACGGLDPGTGQKASQELQAKAMQRLQRAGWAPDYVRLCTRDDLRPWTGQGTGVALAAARLGATRLIDNLEFGPNAS